MKSNRYKIIIGVVLMSVSFLYLFNRVNAGALSSITFIPGPAVNATGTLYMNASNELILFDGVSSNTVLTQSSGITQVSATAITQGIFGSSVSGSNNQYIFKPATNSTGMLQVQTSTGGIVFNVDTTNTRVGVGTASPARTLDVTGPIRTSNGQIYGGASLAFLTDGSGAQTGSFSGLLLGSSYDTTPAANQIRTTANQNLDINTRGTGYLTFSTADTEDVRLTNAGNFGIGTTTPSAKLEVVNSASGQIARLQGGTDDTNYEYVGYYSGPSRKGIMLWNGAWSGCSNITSEFCIKAESGNKLSLYSNGGAGEHILIMPGSGNVGIGTSTPEKKLTITSATAGDGIFINNTLSTSYGTINFKDSSGATLTRIHSFNPSWVAAGAWQPNGLALANNTQGVTLVADGASGILRFFTGGNLDANERMRITSAGNVGIGTTTPATALHVIGTVTATAFSGPMTGALSAANVSADVFGRLQGNGNFAFPAGLNIGTSTATGAPTNGLFVGGNVGIGTTAPYSLLQVEKVAVDNTAYKSIATLTAQETAESASYADTGSASFGLTFRRNWSGGSYTNLAGIYAYGVSGWRGGLAFRTKIDATSGGSPVTTMVIQPDGNVGIGTTTPAVKLHVIGSVRGSGSGGALRIDTGNGYVDIGPQNTTWAHFQTDRASFYFGQTITLGSGILSSYSNANLVLQTSGTTRVTIATSTGNVGIGTVTPGSDVSMTGGLAINGTNSTQLVVQKSGVGALAVNVGEFVAGDVNLYDKVGGGYNRAMTFRSGNVGIGTTTPALKTNIVGTTGLPAVSGTAQVGMLRLSPGDAYGSVIDIGQEGPNTGKAWIQSTDRTNLAIEYPLLLNPNGGNVGIGKTNPATALDVNGTVTATAFSGPMTGALSAANITSDVFGRLQGNGNFAFPAGLNIGTSTATGAPTNGLFVGGNVGVGTIAPTQKLSVFDNVNDWTGISLQNSTGQRWNITAGISGIANNRFAISTNTNGTSPAFVIDTTNNVGIGTTGPLGNLHIAGSGNTSLLVEGGVAGTPQIVLKQTTTARGYLYYAAGLSALKLNEDGSDAGGITIKSGNVGIGTTAPGATLDVQNNADVWATRGIRLLGPNMTNGSSLMISTGIADSVRNQGQMYFYYDGSGSTSNRLSFGLHSVDNVLNILGTGKVGIGTTAPTAKLEVVNWSGAYDNTSIGILAGDVGSGGYNVYNIRHTWNSDYGVASDDADMWINYTGYQGGTSYFRDLRIGNGKNYAIAFFDGSSGNVGIGTTAPLDKFQVAADNSVIALGESGGANLLFNGGAEDGTEGWISRDFGIDGNVGSGSTSATALSGSYAFIAQNDGGLNQAVEVIPSAVYTVSLRMRVNTQGVGDGSQGQIVVGTTATARDILDTSCSPNTYDVTPNTNKWVFCSATFTAPATTDVKTATVYVGFRANSYTHAVLVDNVMLVRGGIPQAYNPLATFVGSNGALALTGIVGVGTSTPSAAAHLTVSALSGISINTATGRIVNLGTPIAATDAATRGYVDGLFSTSSVGYWTGASTNIYNNNAGNVGVGTSTPAYKLQVYGSFASDSGNLYTDGVGNMNAVSFYDKNNSLYFLDPSAGTSLKTAGTVLIGGSGTPGAQLEVTGITNPGIVVSSTNYPTTYKTQLGVQGTAQGVLVFGNNGTNEIRFGSTAAGGLGNIYVNNTASYTAATDGTLAMSFLANGNVGVGTSAPGTNKLYVNGATYINGNLAMGANNISLTGNITGVTKLTVQTIDPLYSIDGAKYATYAASIAGGVKEEYVGKGKLISNSKFQILNESSNDLNIQNSEINLELKTQNLKLYQYSIDFNNVERGSDLWVWYNAVDFSKEGVEAFATPYGTSADMYYEIQNNTLTFYGNKSAEFSYRLIGRRHDWKDWPTYVKDQTETPSFTIQSKKK